MSNDVALGNFAAAFLSHEPPLSWGQNGLLLFQPRISPTIRGFEEEDGGRNLTLSMLEWRQGGDVEEGAYLEGNLLRTCPCLSNLSLKPNTLKQKFSRYIFGR